MDAHAGFMQRTIASIIDWCICFGLILVFSFFAAINATKTPKWYFFLLIVFPILYRCIFESSRLQATPGKAYMGIQVVTVDGERISFGRSVVKLFLSYLSSVTFIGYLLVLFTPRRQTLHDLLSGVIVINQTADRDTSDLGYSTIWFDQVKTLVNSFFEGDRNKSTLTGAKTQSQVSGTLRLTPAQTKTLDILSKMLAEGKISQADFDLRKQRLTAKKSG